MSLLCQAQFLAKDSIELLDLGDFRLEFLRFPLQCLVMVPLEYPLHLLHFILVRLMSLLKLELLLLELSLEPLNLVKQLILRHLLGLQLLFQDQLAFELSLDLLFCLGQL